MLSRCAYDYGYILICITQCNMGTDFVSNEICRGGFDSKKKGKMGSIYGRYIIKSWMDTSR